MIALLTKEEARARLRLSATAFHQLLKRGDGPPALRLGRRVLFREAELEAWLAGRSAPHGPPPAEAA